MRSFRLLLSGMTGCIFALVTRARIAFLSYPFSLITCSRACSAGRASHTREKPSMSWRAPPVSAKETPIVSCRHPAWIVVEKPPRERPKAWAACPPFFLTPPPHGDGHGYSCYQCRDLALASYSLQGIFPTESSIGLVLPSVESAYRRHPISHTPGANLAKVFLCVSDIIRLQETSDHFAVVAFQPYA